jgi:lipopolysaccharide export system permease protein
MKTIRRLIYKEIFAASAFVLLGFLALFFFFDVVDELSSVGRPAVDKPGLVYGLGHALLYVALQMPNRIYELLPITVLIGSIVVLARMAKTSEYTILRTSGLDPWRALGMMLGLGLVFVVLTFVTGDYIAPASDRAAQLLKARFRGQISVGHTGAWLKERQTYFNHFVNVGRLDSDGQLGNIRIFTFDAEGRLAATLRASRGQIDADSGTWIMHDVQRRIIQGVEVGGTRVTYQHIPRYQWKSSITAEMISVALLKPDRMRTTDLFAYSQHLAANNQSTLRYDIEFWRKVFYPLSCLVMVVLALPFAYMHFRTGGTTGYVFGGVMIGISFFLLNNVFGYIGNLHQWQPWAAAAAPALIYSVLSLSAFGWMVLRR